MFVCNNVALNNYYVQDFILLWLSEKSKVEYSREQYIWEDSTILKDGKRREPILQSLPVSYNTGGKYLYNV